MNDKGSKPVSSGWRRFLPLTKRAQMAHTVTKKGGELADWICPEFAEQTQTKTPTSPKAGASDTDTDQGDD